MYAAAVIQVHQRNILILHLKRFINNEFFGTIQFYSLNLKTTTENVSSFPHSYKLFPQICHSGTFSGGHWANILNELTWLKCNDKIVMPIKPDAINNRDSYVLFCIQS